MSFATAHLARHGLLSANFLHCAKLWQIRRSTFASAAIKLARNPPRSGLKPSTNIPAKVASEATSTNLPHRVPLLKSSSMSEVGRKQNLARAMIESGETLLYRAPSHFGFLAGTFVVAGVCTVGIYTMFLNEFWRPQPGFPWWVTSANRVGMATMTFMAGWIILRASRHITSIKLLPKGDEVKMLVTVRRLIPLPFVPQKKIVTSPSDFVLPSRMVAQLAIPSWANVELKDLTGSFPSRVLKRLSIGLWRFFAGTRKVFTHEGFMDVTINRNSGMWKLDTDGKFAKGGRSLLDIVSFET